jgi:hypothetical protein
VLNLLASFSQLMHHAEVREAMAPLKHEDVIAVRSDVARTASEVRTDQKDVVSMLSKLQTYQVS